MDSMKGVIVSPLPLSYVLRLCFVFGVTLGVIAIPFYTYEYVADLNVWKLILAVVLTPIANGLLVVVYGLIGYPAYVHLAKRKRLGLDRLALRSD